MWNNVNTFIIFISVASLGSNGIRYSKLHHHISFPFRPRSRRWAYRLKDGASRHIRDRMRPVMIREHVKWCEMMWNDVKWCEMRPQSSNAIIIIKSFCRFVVSIRLAKSETTSWSSCKCKNCCKNWSSCPTGWYWQPRSPLSKCPQGPRPKQFSHFVLLENWGPWGHSFRGTFLSDTHSRHSQSNPQQKVGICRNAKPPVVRNRNERKHPVLQPRMEMGPSETVLKYEEHWGIVWNCAIASSETSSALSVSVSVSGSELKTYGEPQLLLPPTSPMSMAKSALIFW